MMFNSKLVHQVAVGAAFSIIVGGASAMAASTIRERPLSNSQTEIANAGDTTAVVMNFGLPRGLSVRVDGDPASLSREINEREDRNLPIADGGFLSVMDEASWASFSFRSLGGRYGGLFLKTDGVGAYQFRCSLEGDFVISWSPEPDGPCENNDGKNVLKINRSGSVIGRISDWKRPIAIAKSMFRPSAKQIAQAATPFPDISSSIYRAEIERAYSLGFTAGDPPNEDGVRLFRPNDPLSREEAVSFILEAIGAPANELNGRSSFPDVYDSDWSDGKIAYAERNNIVSGFQDGTFAPNARRDSRGLVTRAQLMAMLKGVAGPPFFSGLTVGDVATFSDTAGHWASSTITDMSSYCGVASPLNEQGSNFAPDLPATRAFTAAAIVRLHDCAQPTTIVEEPPEPVVEDPLRPDEPSTDAGSSDGLNLELDNELTLVKTDKRGNANTFEVLQGSIRITSAEFPIGKTVRQGQKITIVNGDIGSSESRTIDNFAVEATSCSILQALNPNYVLSSQTPQSLRAPIMQQIETHRKFLKLSGRSASLSALAQGIIDEINLAREEPRNYANLLMEYWRNLEISGQGSNLVVELSDGSRVSLVKATENYNETIEFLTSNNRLEPLITSVGMSQAAKDWVDSQSGNETITRRNDLRERVSRYGTTGCRGRTGIAETVYISPRTNLKARDIVFDFMLAATTPDSKNKIFSRDYQRVGLSCASDAQYGILCSINFAAGYIDNDS